MADPIYFLNAYDGAKYTIMRYVGRYAVPVAPVIGPANNAGALHVAWPSAFRRASGQHIVYGSRHVDGKWLDVARWISTDGVSYQWAGVALAANETEPNGIGPAQVYYDATRARPWLMVYGRRSAQGTADRLDLADSADGVSWERRGPVLTLDQPYESAGVSPSWVMKLIDGRWALYYHGYPTLSQGVAAVAYADSPVGPFGSKGVLMQPTNVNHAVSSGVRLTSSISVSGAVRVGEPYVLRQMGGGAMQVVWPIRQEGTTVYLDDPLLANYGPAELAHIARNKVDPSLIRQHSDGTFSGIWTGYGMHEGETAEYTFEVESPSPSGPWTIRKADIPFDAWNLGSLFSAENPTPVVPVD